jgi:DNA sulfur modification protein DndC
MNHEQRAGVVADIIREISGPIVIGYSGGKDSSAVVKLFWRATEILGREGSPVEIVYCDTLVENPIVDSMVKATLAKLQLEALEQGLPISVRVIEPEPERTFFVRVAGRGYPPPTSHFRWCTMDMRIRPFRSFLEGRNQKTWIAVGTRFGESQQRDRSLSLSQSQSSGSQFIQRQRDGFPNASLITPIIDYDTADVWEALCELERPSAIDVTSLAKTYKDGSGECPTVRDFKDKPCTKARFGCWTCTVVRRDRSAEQLIDRGHLDLKPLLDFRNWLSEYRNPEVNRCTHRRNGSEGKGPFTIPARLEILDRLLNLERVLQRHIVTEAHLDLIGELIYQDLSSERYCSTDLQARRYSISAFQDIRRQYR